MRQVRLRTILIVIAVLSTPLAWWASRWKEAQQDAVIDFALDQLIKDSSGGGLRRTNVVRDNCGCDFCRVHTAIRSGMPRMSDKPEVSR